MKTVRRQVLVCMMAAAALDGLSILRADDDDTKAPFLEGRIVAAGIPGISAISQVGAFLPGGPIHDNPAFAKLTQPGQVLDPKRLLVGSASNFGESVADPGELPGPLLSIDPSAAGVLVIPPRFAAGGGQASALGGSVQMYSANHAAFLNSIHNGGAAMASYPG